MLIIVNLPRHSWYATQLCDGQVTVFQRDRDGNDEKIFTVVLDDRKWTLAPDGKGIVVRELYL